MQNQLPAVIQREKSYELDPQSVSSTMPAPENGFPHFEGYSVVSVKVREATITATNNPMNHGITETAERVAPAIQMYDAARQGTATNFFSEDVLNRHVQPSGSAWQQSAARDLASQAVPKRKRLIGKDAAIWICVAQLGVIIWMMSPVAQKLTQPGGINVPAASANIGSTFNTAVMWPLNALGMAPCFGDSGKISVGKKHVAKKQNAKRSYSRGKVPPPPPDVAMHGMGKFFVPPPPVAYALPAGAGAGAVAASTLAHATDVDSTANALPKPTKKIHLPALTASTASIVPVEEDVPADTATLGSTATESAPAPGTSATTQTNTSPVSSENNADLFKSYSWQESMRTGIAPVEQPQVQPIRTVMAGNRKRTITDR